MKLKIALVLGVLTASLWGRLITDGYNFKITGGNEVIPFGQACSTLTAVGAKVVLEGDNRVSYLQLRDSFLKINPGTAISYLEGDHSKIEGDRPTISALMLKNGSTASIKGGTISSISISDSNLTLQKGVVASLVVGNGGVVNLNGTLLTTAAYTRVKPSYPRPGQIVLYPNGRLLIAGKFEIEGKTLTIRYKDGTTTMARLVLLRGGKPRISSTP